MIRYPVRRSVPLEQHHTNGDGVGAEIHLAVLSPLLRSDWFWPKPVVALKRRFRKEPRSGLFQLHRVGDGEFLRPRPRSLILK